MKHVKIMPLPECDKIVYSGGTIARQIGTLFVFDDDYMHCPECYPILAGGREEADGYVPGVYECYDTPVVCREGEKIGPRKFAKFVKMGLHEDIPTSSYDLYHMLLAHGGDLQLPVSASTKETIRDYRVELEIEGMKGEACCYSSSTASFYFEVYFDHDNHDALYHELMAQLMEYINILDTEELFAKITFTTVNIEFQDVIDRLNTTPIDTRYCDMYEPRK